MYDPARDEDISLPELLNQGRLQEAIALLRLAIQTRPDDALQHSLLALCLEETGSSQEAFRVGPDGQ